MKILFAASESIPFIKTGGLADVVGTLPASLAQTGDDVRVIVPKYRDIPQMWKDKMTHLLYFYVNLGWRRQYCGIDALELGGVTYYFVDNEFYFARDSVYGSGEEEGERFGYFCRAVLEAISHIGFRPDVLHCHDWQTGMIPVLLNTQYRNNTFYRDIKTVFTIHNLRFQGVFPWMYIDDLLGIGEKNFTPDRLEYYGGISFMKGGIVFSDAITTVSPTYAQEIQNAYYGERLDGLIRTHKTKLSGILNGIDAEYYDPRNDRFLAARFSPGSLAGKAVCKRAMQEELGLNIDPDVPLIAMVTRLTEQKGIDLVECVLDDILRSDVQLAVLGKGEERYGELFSWAAWRYQGRMAARIELNEALSHRLYAAADILLMPSQFEPCGLSQMIAMRYGAIPIVRETGGLHDSVIPYNKYTDEGNGFSFANYNAHEMLFTIERAIEYYHDKPLWERMVRRAMESDFSWEHSAAQYRSLYAKLTGVAPAPQPEPAKAAEQEQPPKPAKTEKEKQAKPEALPASPEAMPEEIEAALTGETAQTAVPDPIAAQAEAKESLAKKPRAKKPKAQESALQAPEPAAEEKPAAKEKPAAEEKPAADAKPVRTRKKKDTAE